MNYIEVIGVLAGIGTLILIIIGISKFFARLYQNRDNINYLKNSLQKINARLLDIEKEQIRISSYFDYYFEEKWRKK